jgi:tetratricopeptide (TPR) repeat protein
MIPTEKEWTVIFSGDHERWGSFGYDEKADALRTTVTPAAAPMTESLAYSFDQVTDESAEVALRWEKLRVAFPVKVNTKAETAAALRRDLTGLAQFFWQPWNNAANWCINNNACLDDAETWVNRSIEMNANFANNKTKSKLMRLKGDGAGADALLASSLTTATEAEVNLYGYELMNQGQQAEAIEIFRKNAKDHPQSWNVHDSLGEGLAAAGRNAEAIAAYRKALSLAPAAQKQRIEGVLARLAAR